MTSPNGGEVLASGNPQTITWTTNTLPRAAAKTTLSYTCDGGTTWTTIARVIGNPGSSSWIPTVNAPRNNCGI